MHPAVQIFNITKHFGDLAALDQINLTIDSEEILRPNGAGKIALIQILTTVLQSTKAHAVHALRLLMYDGNFRSRPR